MADCFITSYVNRYAVPLYESPYGVSANAIDDLFATSGGSTQAGLDSLAGTILLQGIDFYQNGNYNRAIQSFKSAAALSPYSDNSAKSYEYMGLAYLQLDNTDAAIKTYKEAVRLYPTDDTFSKALGDLYLKENRTDEAVRQYKAAVYANPTSADNLYSLGQAYLSAGELSKAQEQFTAVTRISPNSAAGFYGLGQVAHLSGNLTDAVSQLTHAINVNKNFELAYLELGYVYADQGDFSSADDQLATLKSKKSDKATTLSSYITLAAKPKMIAALGIDGFNTNLGPNTKVSSLSSSLTAANTSKLFSMKIAFSKDMDQASIINPYNWKISRATIRNNGGVYNNGLTPPATEAAILPKPAYILFNPENNTATVRFWVSQNANANATIDPKHIVFKFSGVDTYGKAMDTSADEYSGFSQIV